jgi:hypothetical protein
MEHWMDLPPNPSSASASQSALERFISSMTITYEMWHDGDGYDLDALRRATPAELKTIETTLIQHSPRDWRDIEALALIDSPPARQAVEAGLKSGDPAVRREAMEHAGEKLNAGDRQTLLLNALRSDDMFGGLGQAIDEAAEFHPPAVIDALLRGAIDRTGQTAVHFAALLFYVHGKSAEPFDWAHRPFFLRFDTADRDARKVVFRELCRTIGVDPAKYLAN